jgi:hypothetical protein
MWRCAALLRLVGGVGATPQDRRMFAAFSFAIRAASRMTETAA